MRKLLGALFGKTGGIGYHLAALVYSGKLWAPFRIAVSAELGRRFTAEFGPDLSRVHLILVGPSGGYCLEQKLLERFGRITAVDIDPVARLFFRGHFIQQDFFTALERAGWNLDRWVKESILSGTGEKPPVRAFLFSNLLGQLEYVLTESRFREVELGLAKALNRPTARWISFHDVLSSPVDASVPEWRRPTRADPKEVAAHFFAGKSTEAEARVEVESHAIGKWAEGASGEVVYFPWRLSSARTQVIEVLGRLGAEISSPE